MSPTPTHGAFDRFGKISRLRHGLDFVRTVISLLKFAASGKVQAKKDLGLMQMQYKNVYVAYTLLPSGLCRNFIMIHLTGC